ncbi:MAG: hypothetical protein ACFE0O_13560 [Opitutales bacterium]
MTLQTAIEALVTPGDQPDAHDLRTCLQSLDRWLGTRPDIDRELLHFLQRRSYGKALAWLQEHPEAAEGNIELTTEP